MVLNVLLITIISILLGYCIGRFHENYKWLKDTQKILNKPEGMEFGKNA